MASVCDLVRGGEGGRLFLQDVGIDWFVPRERIASIRLAFHGVGEFRPGQFVGCPKPSSQDDVALQRGLRQNLCVEVLGVGVGWEQIGEVRV